MTIASSADDLDMIMSHFRDDTLTWSTREINAALSPGSWPGCLLL